MKKKLGTRWVFISAAFVLPAAGLEREARGEETEHAYTWADQPSVAKYKPEVGYVHNAAGAAEIERASVGQYQVRFAGIGAKAATTGGNVQITAYGAGSDACKVEQWGPSGADFTIKVRCFDSTARPVDAQYSLLATLPKKGEKEVAHAWGDNPTAPSYNANPKYAYTASNAPVAIKRSAPGKYEVRFPGVSRGKPTGGNVQVTAYGPGPERCKVERWGAAGQDLSVNIFCFDIAGKPVDSQYSVLVTWK